MSAGLQGSILTSWLKTQDVLVSPLPWTLWGRQVALMYSKSKLIFVRYVAWWIFICFCCCVCACMHSCMCVGASMHVCVCVRVCLLLCVCVCVCALVRALKKNCSIIILEYVKMLFEHFLFFFSVCLTTVISDLLVNISWVCLSSVELWHLRSIF